MVIRSKFVFTASRAVNNYIQNVIGDRNFRSKEMNSDRLSIELSWSIRIPLIALQPWYLSKDRNGKQIRIERRIKFLLIIESAIFLKCDKQTIFIWYSSALLIYLRDWWSIINICGSSGLRIDIYMVHVCKRFVVLFFISVIVCFYFQPDALTECVCMQLLFFFIVSLHAPSKSPHSMLQHTRSHSSKKTERQEATVNIYTHKHIIGLDNTRKVEEEEAKETKRLMSDDSVSMHRNLNDYMQPHGLRKFK